MIKKALITICLLFIAGFTIIQAQSDDKQRASIIRATIWKAHDADFADTVVPAKWKENSQVVLSRKIDYRISKDNGLLHEHYYFHERVKLQDEAAVTEFSEFSFNEDYKFPGLFSRNEINNYVGFKVIKQDGTEKIIDTEEAVNMSMEKGRDKLAYNKIAIPDLEPGDIVDYYLAIEFQFKAPSFYLFDPVYYTFIESNPIKKQKIEIKLEDKCYLNARSINGAPELQAVQTHSNYHAYALADSNRNALEDAERLSYSRDMPMLKIQPYYSFSSVKPTTVTNISSLFAGSRENIKSEIEAYDLNKLESMITTYTSPFASGLTGVVDPYSGYIKATLKYLRKNYSKKHSAKQEVARDAYYFLREYYYRKLYMRAHTSTSTYQPMFYALDQYGLIHTLAATYKKWGVDFDILFTTPNTICQLDDWLFLQEIIPFLQVTESDTFFITDISPTQKLDDIPSYIQGNQAYVVPVHYSTNYLSNTQRNIERIEIPPYDYLSNEITVKIDAEIEDFESPLKARYNYLISGSESYRWDSLIVTSEDFYKNRNSKYTPYIPVTGYSPYTSQSFSKAEDLTRIEEVKKRDDFLKAIIKGKTGIEDIQVDNFTLNNAGRWEESPQLDFSFDVSFDDLIVDIGTGYILPTGTFLGNDSRVQNLKDTVTCNFLTKGPYKFTQIVRIELPAGYKVKRLSDLDSELENSTGQFKVATEIDGNTFIIRTEEMIYSDYLEKEHWQPYSNLMKQVYELTAQQTLIEQED